ncbi:MAG: STAS domain-containing protein [Simplicispira sp.]|nr:STAS domain-containing protein [Simplicispira sp.]
MSKEDTPTGGLLSKVVRFVRNPTVNWTDLDSIEADRESQYSKQMLKEMIERKRRNDFVRRREFDQLRKLRARDALTGQRVEDPAARPSFFQSSLTSPDDRAGTIKKIDEIEAQMSMQWWKSKQNADAPTEPMGLGAAPPGRPVPEEAGSAGAAFAPTAPLALPAAPAAPLFADNSMAIAAFGSAAGAQPPGHAPAVARAAPAAAPELERFVHEPDLEEAAIRFANGDHEGAEAGLQDVLAQHANDAPEPLLEIWMTLFDLFRATGQQDRFDALAINFAARFDRSAPLWFSMPAQLGMEPPPADDAAPVRRDFSWNAPAKLSVQTVAALQAALGRAVSPWTLTWSRLTDIDEAAVPLLADEFERWAEQAGQFVFVGAGSLQAVLEAHTQSGDREQAPHWWRLRMAVLRLMGRPDEFEMVALDYCVTYEVSPPSWQSPRCAYQDDGGAAPAAPTTGGAELMARASWTPLGPGEQASAPAPLVEGAQGLVGHVEGDATAALEAVAAGMAGAPKDVPLQVRCDRLIRIDFSAAGSVLNWAAEQQAQGRVVQFLNLHRLVAVFFNVVGINEHSWVVARKD